MKKIAVAALTLAVLVPGEAEAQRHSGRTNQFSFSPYVGAFKDAYDLAADGSNLGWLAGFKAGYQESQRLSLHINVGYGEANDVASRSGFSDVVIDNHWVLLTGGGDFALVPGNTSVAAGVEAGVGWRRTAADEDGLGSSSDGWGSYEVLAPSLTLRHRFSPRAGLFVSAHDYIFDILEGEVEHTPALTLGLSFR